MTHRDSRAQLAELRLRPFPLGSITPSGWMKEQLRTQAEGLTGHIDEFWPDIAESAWIGGTSEGWERGPYWLDGLVPLAFLLDDDRLKGKSRRWVDAILDSQRDDGWIGPRLDADYGYEHDPWPVFVVFKALVQYYEVTEDERIPQALVRFLRYLSRLLDSSPMRSWARYRWADLVQIIHWLFDRTGEEWLLEVAKKLHDQGFDWRALFEHFPHRHRSRREECDLETHVVNNAMGIKAPAIWYRQSRDAGDLAGTRLIIHELDAYHGQANGAFSGDEHLAGKNPSQGTELCSVVEYMYSLELALQVTADPELADRLEQLAFNALPATISPDMWSHQYDQQVNQVVCKVNRDRIWTNNGPESNIFGLAPNYGCCTANMHQGWPKFVSHLWMRTDAGGIAAVAYAPSVLRTKIDERDVVVELETSYPFSEELVFHVTASAPVTFPLDLRIPYWAQWAEVTVDGEATDAAAGSFFRVTREWRDTTTVTLRLPSEVRLSRRYNRSVAVYSGPLLYALRIGEDWREYRGEAPHNDWQVFPTTDWNYAIEVDREQPASSFVRTRGGTTGSPFVSGKPPVTLTARGRKLDTWDMERGSAAAPPPSPVHSDEPIEELTFVPYGCTGLRVAELPVLEVDRE